jgi:hypothetical protein
LSDLELRRQLLSAAAGWIGGLAALTAGRSAKAWQVEEIDPASRLGRAYADRCGGPSAHQALLSRLQAQLANDPSAQSLSAACPICGCRVTAIR